MSQKLPPITIEPANRLSPELNTSTRSMNLSTASADLGTASWKTACGISLNETVEFTDFAIAASINLRPHTPKVDPKEDVDFEARSLVGRRHHLSLDLLEITNALVKERYAQDPEWSSRMIDARLGGPVHTMTGIHPYGYHSEASKRIKAIFVEYSSESDVGEPVIVMKELDALVKVHIAAAAEQLLTLEEECDPNYESLDTVKAACFHLLNLDVQFRPEVHARATRDRLKVESYYGKATASNPLRAGAKAPGVSFASTLTRAVERVSREWLEDLAVGDAP